MQQPEIGTEVLYVHDDHEHNAQVIGTFQAEDDPLAVPTVHLAVTAERDPDPKNEAEYSFQASYVVHQSDYEGSGATGYWKEKPED